MDHETERSIEDVTQLGQEWAAAELKGETAFLDRLLIDDFIGIGPRGFMLTKDQWLARYTSGDLRYESFTWDEVNVRVFGDAAIATGRQSQTGTHRDHDIGAQVRAMLVFVRQNASWRLAGLQLSPIGELTVGG